jgi:hypothetical protein
LAERWSARPRAGLHRKGAKRARAGVRWRRNRLGIWVEGEKEVAVSYEEGADPGIRGRISQRGEEAIGDVAQALLENPIFNQALAAALGAGEKAVHAQRSAMGALNLPAASDVERLERRVRSISERVEAIEDRLDEVARDLAALRSQAAPPQSVATDQARLDVREGSGEA